jgi:hypothetical protein
MLLLSSSLLQSPLPAAAQVEPDADRITVDVSWQDDHLVYVNYQIAEEADPRYSPDGPYGHGCAWSPEGHNTTPRTLEVVGPGRYVVAVYFVGWCLDYSDAGNEEPDPLGASEAYPEGSPIEVTARVTYWQNGSQVGTRVLRGTASVHHGLSSEAVWDYWTVLGDISLGDPLPPAPPEGHDPGEEPVPPEDPLPGAGEEGDTASPGSEAELPGDLAPSGDPGVVPPGMDPGVLGGPLVGDPGQVAQVLDDAEPDTGWSAMEILLAILLALTGVVTVALAVKYVLGLVIGGERPDARLASMAVQPSSDIAAQLNRLEPSFDKARDRERRRAAERIRSVVVATKAPGSVAVSRPVDVTVGGRQVAVLQPGQPYTRIGFAPDGRTVVRWGPGADDIGVVPTEALQTLPPPLPP